jgi:hypothetical protein
MSANQHGRALDVLCSPQLSDIVELVAWSPEPDLYEVRAVDGHVRFTRREEAGRHVFSSATTSGRDVLATQDPTRFAPLSQELAHQQPDRSANAYPHAYEHIAQVFDHPCAPDLLVIHTAAHRSSSHLGEHGSLSVVQARAPFIVSGAGVRRAGIVDGHCRLVDVAPTILAMLGLPTGPGIGPTGQPADDLHLARQDGTALTDVLDPEHPRPRRVVGILIDGANANVLYDAASSGEAPAIARLIEKGIAYRHGAVASLPTVTLPNHTAILTGCHPGHHGVLHNAWYDRSLGRQIVTESPSTWQTAMQWLSPGVETIHHALKRSRPEAVTISINEPADPGADYSTFDVFRAGESSRLVPDLSSGPPPLTTTEHYGQSRSYRQGTVADVMALAQATAVLSGHHLGSDYELPMFLWVNTTLTDAAFHEGGPHSEIARAAIGDTDSRIGALVAAVERAGAGDETAYVLMADHGMEQTAADVTGDWNDALRAEGIVCRDEASGFLYLGVSEG